MGSIHEKKIRTNFVLCIFSMFVQTNTPKKNKLQYIYIFCLQNTILLVRNKG